MDEIIKNIWLNLTNLNGTQWLLIISISCVLSYGLFRFFNWHFKSRFEAQSQLIDLKEKQIEYYAWQVKSNPKREKIIVEKSNPILPDNWVPFLEQPKNFLLEELPNVMQQQPMNKMSADLCFISDGELLVSYVKLYELLPEKEKEKLLNEQTKFISDRFTKTIEIHEGGGTISPYLANMEFYRITETRLKELNNRIENKIKA
ncbi:MAG: hypothetical protein HXY50_11480 [Ignavibacteriaceae bacterium]|nr:hypothetical protein [Ignavibacteriaceae bacterium]